MARHDGEAWLEQAARDLKVAADNLAMDNFETVCFLSQQSAEKALKGFLLLAGRSHQRIHSVTELLEECVRLDSTFESLRPVVELDVYYTSTRYPDALVGGAPYHSFTKEMAERCLSLASSTIEFVRKSSAS
jgi:HEPN domain-containing protein